MKFFEAKIRSKYTPKRTKLHHLKKISRGGMPPNPPSKVHGFAMRSMSLRDMQISKSGKKFLGPPPAKSWGRACAYAGEFRGICSCSERVLKMWCSLVCFGVYFDHIVS